MRHRRTGSLALGLALFAAALGSGTAFANHTADCTASSQVKDFAGMAVAAGDEGASANLDSEFLNLCTNRGSNDVGANFGWASVGTSQCTVAGACGSSIIQIGRGTCWVTGYSPCDATSNIFWAWGRNNEAPGCSGSMDVGAAVTDLGPAPSSGAYAYQVFRNASGSWTGQVLDSGGIVEAFTFLSAGSICWTSRQAVWFQESWNLGDPLGGQVTNTFRSTGNKYKTTAGGSWNWTAYNASNACHVLGADPPHECDAVSATAFDTWTDR